MRRLISSFEYSFIFSNYSYFHLFSLQEWNTTRMMLDTLIDYLFTLGVSKASTETLKGFLYMDGPLEDVVNCLQNKGLSSRRKAIIGTLRKVLADLMEIRETSVTMGVKVKCSYVFWIVIKDFGHGYKYAPVHT